LVTHGHDLKSGFYRVNLESIPKPKQAAYEEQEPVERPLFGGAQEATEEGEPFRVMTRDNDLS